MHSISSRLPSRIFLVTFLFASVLGPLAIPGCTHALPNEELGQAAAALTGTVTVNAATRYQTMQGWGVDGQPRSWGTTGARMKTQVLDPLIDDMGSNLFRVEIFKGASDWESTNDDANPNNYNWTYYDNLYATNKDFQDFVAYVRYLNSKGITNIEVAAHGLAPTWMAGSHNGLAGACITNESGCIGVPANAADEWAEEIVSFVEWSHNRLSPGLQFAYVAPFNETDLCTTEGICLGGDSAAAVTLLAKVVTRMNAFPDLNSIKLVAPEASSVGSDFRSAIMANATVAPRIAALAYHIYSPGSAPAPNTYNTATPPEWNTEFNGFSGICANSIGWGNATTHADLLVADLQAGNTVELVWADVDAWHIHQDNFQTFGLFFTSFATANPAVSDATRCSMAAPPTATQLDGAVYSPNVTYSVTKQFSKFVKPGAQRVSVTLSDSANGSAVAFVNPDGSIVVAGRNTSTTSSQSITLSVSGLTQNPTSLSQYYTNATSRFVKDPATYTLTSNGGTVTSSPIVIPPDSVFTLVSSSIGPSVTLTSPQSNQVFAGGPSSVSFSSTAAASSGRSIASVGYYEGGTLLCNGVAPAFGCSATLSLGTHASITAKTTDNTGATGSSGAITVYVQGGAPSVSITAPVASGTYSAAAGAAVTFAAGATASSGLTVTRVDFLEGTTLLCTATTGPSFTCPWTAPLSGGTHTVIAKATDSSNNVSTSTSIVVAVAGASVLLGDPVVEPSDDTTSANFIDSFQSVASATGTVSALDVYVPTTSATTNMRLGLYGDVVDQPGSLLGSCAISTVTKNAWNACSLATGVNVTAGAKYWIAAMSTAGSETLRVGSGGKNCWSNAAVGSSLPTTFASSCGVGQGALYAASASVAVATVPGSPTGVIASAGNAAATVTWTAPSSNGGSLITGYRVTSSPGGFIATTTGATSATVASLTNGTAYTFSVVAINAAGNSAASSASNLVTPAASTTAPGGPTGVTAVPGNAQATVSWSAPASNGGSAITGYRVTSNPGAFVATTTGATTATVTGLTNGTAYTFTVVATNAVGNSVASGASNVVTPAASAIVLLGDATTEATPDTTDQGHLDAYRFTASAGTLRQLCVFVPAASASTSLTVGLYSNSTSNTPGTLISGTSVTMTALTKGGWNCQALGSGVALSATDYWITVLSTAGASSLQDNLGVGSNCWDIGSTTYNALPASFPASQCGVGRASLKGTN